MTHPSGKQHPASMQQDHPPAITPAPLLDAGEAEAGAVAA